MSDGDPPTISVFTTCCKVILNFRVRGGYRVRYTVMVRLRLTANF